MRSPDPAEHQLIALIVGGSGAALIAWAVFLTMRVKARLRGSVATKARVVKTIRARGGSDGGSVTFKVVADFTDEHGASHQFTSKAASSGWGDMVGKDIGIIYMRDDPADVRIHTWWVQWMQVTMFSAVGVLTLILAVMLVAFPDL